ncbi:MAG: TlpA disulfide reductase family protein [Candidatus Kapabacteria bacterium]|nr:TlpA disulfide reductase family protein [Candidatus Kapabacteria bacterium]
MKNISYCILLLLLLFQSAYSDLIINGKILTYEDKTPKLAHISYKNSKGDLVISQADSEGNFSIRVDSKYVVELIVTAVDHKSTTEKFFIPSDMDSLYIISKLSPNRLYPDIKNVLITGNFNNRDFENAPSMTRNADGTYSFDVSYNSDTLLYQIFPEYDVMWSNNTFNGSQSDFYVYDGNGDYFSGIINKEGKFRITLTPSYYPDSSYQSKIEIGDDKYQSEFITFKNITKLSYDYLVDRSNLYVNSKIPDEERGARNIDLKKKSLELIKQQIADLKDKNARLLSIFEYLEVAHDGVNIRGIEESVDKNLIREIYTVEPVSPIWDESVNYYHLVFAEILLGHIENPEYIYKVLSSNHTDKTKAGILSLLVRYCSYNQLENLKDKYYEKLQAEYADTKEAKMAKGEFGKDKAIQVGKIIPDFTLKNLDNESELITPKSLAGKYVLVDVWGTWCVPCLMELPSLIKAYDTFKSKNFTIFSVAIDASAETVRKFRESKKKMPWLKPEEQIESNLPWMHSYAGNWDCDITSIFEVNGVPETFLIEPEGKIIAIDGLRGDELIETLDKLIKPIQK